jgi:CRISPR/Cas system CMR subunit Cmr6 (Cas7 group RAMP superfamily)
VHGWLEAAVELWGVGARTRAGYGELIVDDSDVA